MSPRSPCLRYVASRSPPSTMTRRLSARHTIDPPTAKTLSSDLGKALAVRKRAARAASSTDKERRYSLTRLTFSFFLVVPATASHTSANRIILAAIMARRIRNVRSRRPYNQGARPSAARRARHHADARVPSCHSEERSDEESPFVVKRQEEADSSLRSE